jgi:hypothetical protein
MDWGGHDHEKCLAGRADWVSVSCLFTLTMTSAASVRTRAACRSPCIVVDPIFGRAYRERDGASVPEAAASLWVLADRGDTPAGQTSRG